MTIIPLRAYNREIESLIQNGQLDEAVAHCRHILATYPKYIASYRLLGKAHLEQQRISDATDIFQRVLSSVPDDFIANVGMSIIREDENNLDAAIWHMELAYEAQPANIAIQDELRRLYGRRDGVEPQKVRMTRGTLARMYAKGGLYDQAIAELRAAIKEDPNRPDLQLILAEMYYHSAQRVEAVEICANIIKKLPLCLEANRILAVSLSEAEGSEAVKNYRQTVISMDPYYAFASPEAISSNQVPDEAVNIERLDYKSGIQVEEAPAQPNWATSLGISIDQQAEETSPDWLKAAETSPQAQPEGKSAPSVSPFIWDTQEVENVINDTSKPEGEIPDWMKDAGWQPASNESNQPPEEIKPEEPPIGLPENEGIEKAEMPEWLREIAPENISSEGPVDSQKSDADLSLPWLEQHQPGPTDSIIQWLDEKKPDADIIPPSEDEDLASTIDEEIPDWLKDLETTQTPSQEEEPVETQAKSTPAAAAFIEGSNIESSDMPSEEITTDEQEPKIPTEVPEPEAVLPSEPERIPPTPIPEQEEISTSEVEEIPSTEVGEEELAATPVDEIPDWLKELAEEGPPPEEPVKEELAAETLPAPAETEAPLSEIPVDDQSIEPPIEETSAPAIELVPEEVKGMELSKSIEEETTSQELDVTEEATPAEIPNAVEEQPEISQLEEQLQEEKPAPIEVEIASTETSPVSESEPTALADEIPEKQAAEEESIPLKEEAEIPPPEWVKLESEPPVEEAIEPEPQITEESTVPTEEIPEWIKGLGEEPEAEALIQKTGEEIAPEAEISPSEELPTWLQELEVPEIEKEEPAITEETVSADEAPDLMSDEMPAWIKEITESEPVEETLSTEAKTPEEISTVAPDEAQQIEQETEIPSEAAQVAQEEVLEEKAEEPVIPTSEEKVEEPVSATEQVSLTEPVTSVSEEQAEELVTPIIDEMAEESVSAEAEIPAEESVIPVSEFPAEEPLPPTAEEKVEEEVLAATTAEEQPPQEAELPIAQAEASLTDTEVLLEQNQKMLSEARNLIDQGQPTQAIDTYAKLIKQDYLLDEIVEDLTEALYRYPIDVEMWVTLGDAYFKKDSLQEALNAYNKAEELVR